MKNKATHKIIVGNDEAVNLVVGLFLFLSVRQATRKVINRQRSFSCSISPVPSWVA